MSKPDNELAELRERVADLETQFVGLCRRSLADRERATEAIQDLIALLDKVAEMAGGKLVKRLDDCEAKLGLFVEPTDGERSRPN